MHDIIHKTKKRFSERICFKSYKNQNLKKKTKETSTQDISLFEFFITTLTFYLKD